MIIRDNARDLFLKVSNWFLPQLIQQYIPFVIILIIFLVAALLLNRRSDWVRLGQRLTNDRNLPLLLFSIFNMVIILATMISIDHVAPFDGRYYVP